MRNALVTPFWKNAYERLPAEIRGRYLTQFQAAERWELALDAAVEAWSNARSAFARMRQVPRSA